MKKYLLNPITIIGFISLILSIVIHVNDDYMVRKERKCIVLDKLENIGGYRTSGRYYLILKEERGIVFEIVVSPAVYSQSRIGQRVIKNLSEYEIQSEINKTLIYFIGGIMSKTCAVVFLIAGWITRKPMALLFENAKT
jgi:hypothetical protein